MKLRTSPCKLATDLESRAVIVGATRRCLGTIPEEDTPRRGWVRLRQALKKWQKRYAYYWQSSCGCSHPDNSRRRSRY
jgi:hypothetical protein